MEAATLYSKGNGILFTTKLLIKYMGILKIFLDSQGLMFSIWVTQGCYIIREEIKARKKRHGIQKTENTAQKINERKSQSNKGEAQKATNTNGRILEEICSRYHSNGKSEKEQGSLLMRGKDESEKLA